MSDVPWWWRDPEGKCEHGNQVFCNKCAEKLTFKMVNEQSKFPRLENIQFSEEDQKP